MQSQLKPIQTITTRYVNVYRDAKGETHYSTEEFAVGEHAITSMNDAIEDAKRMAKHGWEYIETLVSNNEATGEIDRELLEVI